MKFLHDFKSKFLPKARIIILTYSETIIMKYRDVAQLRGARVSVKKATGSTPVLWAFCRYVLRKTLNATFLTGSLCGVEDNYICVCIAMACIREKIKKTSGRGTLPVFPKLNLHNNFSTCNVINVSVVPKLGKYNTTTNSSVTVTNIRTSCTMTHVFF